nr:Ycf39 [Erythrocladia irregularis]
MTLGIIGATGTLGRQIVREALNNGYQVKCLVRNIRKASFLKEWGAELVYADLSIPETIPQALYGTTTIIDAATSRPSDEYNAQIVDLDGKKLLIEAAEKANIKRYIFFSFIEQNSNSDIPFLQHKLQIEQTLEQSKLNYTIFHLAGFFQGLINQYAIPMLENQSIWTTSESAEVAYIDAQDVAKFTIQSLSLISTEKFHFSLAGPKNWTSQEIIELCEKLGGKRAQVTKISVQVLKGMKIITKLFLWTRNISDRLAFAGIMSSKKTFTADMQKTYNVFNIEPEQVNTLEKYLREYFTKILKRIKQVNLNGLNENAERNENF